MKYNNIEYDVMRSKRNTISIEIKRNCAIVVRCPLYTLDEEIEAFLDRKKIWIKTNIEKMKQIGDTDDKLTYNQIGDIINEAKKVIPIKVCVYAKIIGVNFNSIRIKSQRTCWGSCSQKRNLNFNCLLMLMPERVIDYVVVHELCHIKEMNHSHRFWSEVRSILPDYQWDKKWLRDNGDRIMARMH